MNVTIEIPEGLAATLDHLARRSGTSTADYLSSHVAGHLLSKKTDLDAIACYRRCSSCGSFNGARQVDGQLSPRLTCRCCGKKLSAKADPCTQPDFFEIMVFGSDRDVMEEFRRTDLAKVKAELARS